MNISRESENSFPMTNVLNFVAMLLLPLHVFVFLSAMVRIIEIKIYSCLIPGRESAHRFMHEMSCFV